VIAVLRFWGRRDEPSIHNHFFNRGDSQKRSHLYKISKKLLW
jgi:hypothetical protein